MKQKSKSKSVKGYLQIDIAFAIMIFFILFMTIYTLNKENISSKEKIVAVKELNMQARDYCMMLISSPGLPTNWENSVETTLFFGLKDNSSTELNTNKINSLKTANYFTVRNKFDTISYVNLKITGLDSNTEYLSFGPAIEGTQVKVANYNCYSYYNSEIVQLKVGAWK